MDEQDAGSKSMDNAKAIEAAWNAANDAISDYEEYATEAMIEAAIQAYLAAMAAEGYAFINTRQIKVTSGPPIYNPAARPQIGS